MIQERCSTEPRLRPIVGKAVATMVWSSAPRNIASMIPKTMRRISACESGLWPAQWLWREAAPRFDFFGEDSPGFMGALHRPGRRGLQGSLRQGSYSLYQALLHRKLRPCAALTG